MSDLTHKITTSQEALRTEHNNRNIRCMALLREWAENAFGHEATMATSVTFKLRNLDRPLVAMVHNGKRFKSILDMENAMYPNISIGNSGSQGCGGMLSPLLVVDRVKSYGYMIYSKLEDDEECLLVSEIDDRSVVVKDGTNTILPQIKDILGELIEDCNVAYFANYTAESGKGGEKPMQSAQLMTNLTDFTPHWLSNGKKMRWMEHAYLNYKKTHSQYLSQNSAGGQHVDLDVYNQDQFDSLFMFDQDKFQLLAPLCHLRIDGLNIEFGAEVVIKLYPGLYKTDSHIEKSDYRYGLVVANPSNPKCGKSQKWVARPSFSTFVSSDWCKDKTLARLSRDVHYAGNHLSKISAILHAGFTDAEQRYDDVNEFVELQKAVEKNLDEKSVLKRKPFAKVNFRIKSIHSVMRGGNEQGYSDSDIRTWFGGLNEMFLSKDSSRISKILDAILNGVRSASACNKDAIISLRERVDHWWPKDQEEWAELPEERLTKNNLMKFLDIQNREPITSFDVDSTTIGYLTHANGDEVNPNWEFNAKSWGNSLQYVGGNKWALTISNYHKIDDVSGKMTPCTKDEYASVDARYAAPHRQLRFLHFGDEYLMGYVRTPPRREIACTVRESGGGKPDAFGLKKKSSSMLQNLNPPEKYFEWHGGSVLLNKNNRVVSVVFKKTFIHEDWQTKLWIDIQQKVSNAVRVLDSLDVKGFSGERGQQLSEEWDDDGHKQYLLNELVAPLFESDKVKKMYSLMLAEQGVDIGSFEE
jgi:hypothetical protein